MAATVITIAVEKGGCGKTVTTSNLAYLMGAVDAVIHTLAKGDFRVEQRCAELGPAVTADVLRGRTFLFTIVSITPTPLMREVLLLRSSLQST